MLSCYKAKERRKIKYIRVVTPHAFNRAVSSEHPQQKHVEKKESKNTWKYRRHHGVQSV
jgi:hypothetical protein